MFSQVINSTAMTSNAAEAYFSERITGDNYQGDRTFLSTLRALLDKRIGANHLVLSTNSLCPSSGDVDMGRETCRYYHQLFDVTDYMKLVNLYGSYTDTAFDMIKDYYADTDDWIRLDPITDFFRRSFDVLCFVNARLQETVFFVKNLNMRKYHQLQVGILTALPWYFNPKTDGRPTEIEMELLRALQEKTADHYCDVLNRMAAEANYEEEYTRSMLHKVETKYIQNRLDDLREEIANIHRSIRDYQEQINAGCARINDRSAELFGLEAKIASGENESMLCDYFLSNKSLKLERIQRDVFLYFHVNTYMTYFDSDAAETFLDNPNSTFYRTCGDWTKDEIKKLFTMIFVDQSIRVRMCAGYKLDLRGGFSAVGKMDFDGDEFDRLPNPHIAHYECLGDYSRRINESVKKCDYIGILENAIASAMSVNVMDAPVLNAFVNDIFGGVGGSCFELEDSRKMNINEVREYVQKEMEGENE